MFSFKVNDFYFSNHLLSILGIAVVLSFMPLFYKPKKEEISTPAVLSFKRTAFNVLIIVLCMILCVGEITSSDFNPFIYFKF
jgi:hypothetical protein